MMKRVFVIVIILLSIVSCNNTAPKNEVEPTMQNGVEVLYFHGKQRCVTCNAIENLTREVIETDFSDAVKNGTLVFKIIDISKPENEPMAEKYEVAWSSLFVNQWKAGKETINNMTDFGFSYSKNQPETFKQGIKEKIEQLLH